MANDEFSFVTHGASQMRIQKTCATVMSLQWSGMISAPNHTVSTFDACLLTVYKSRIHNSEYHAKTNHCLCVIQRSKLSEAQTMASGNPQRWFFQARRISSDLPPTIILIETTILNFAIGCSLGTKDLSLSYYQPF